LNITSILLKKVILEGDSETWSRIRKHYLPLEYHPIYKVINSYFEENSGLPSFDALKLSIRNNALLDKIYALQTAEDVDLENSQLLEFLKNEYTQEEIMDQISKYLSESIMMEDARENVEKLQQIILHIENKVELKDPHEDMARIQLFDSQEELERAFALSLNADYDNQMRFSPRDYILIGGRRGAGKSLTCSNIAVNTFDNGRSSMYFTIEMTSRAILQRMCAIATGVSASNLRMRNLSQGEWVAVAKWWSSRFSGGEDAFLKYTKHNSFDLLHQELSTRHSLLQDKQLDIVYDPSMTLARIRSELDKKIPQIKPAVILVDYVNQVKRSHLDRGQYDWTEQIEISKALKAIAQEYEVPVVSPYQIDNTGEARFAKGLLDSADAAFALNAWTKKTSVLHLNV
jgi:replicative DNA helicase